MSDVEWLPGRWWRVVGPDGGIWCETSSEDEARSSMRDGDLLLRLWEPSGFEWREVTS